MIAIKTKEEIEKMREGGKKLAEIVKKVSEAAKPGVKTKDLDKLARELIVSAGAKPAFLGYNGFPASICISINDEVVHGVPSERELKEGDVLSLDAGIIYEDFVTDVAVTLPIGKINQTLKKLIETTKAALNAGIREARVGNRLGKVSSAIQKVVDKEGFGVIREMVGHGIGRRLHEEPQVPNYGNPDDGPVLEEGMVLAIEPMISVGDWRLMQDGLTYKTRDGSYASHFEHTIAITKKGPLILTLG